MDKKYFLMDIKDKVKISDEKFCPPHKIPHTLPIFGELVMDESCHYHENKLRDFHHDFFCKFLKCPHYEFMKEKYEKRD